MLNNCTHKYFDLNLPLIQQTNIEFQKINSYIDNLTYAQHEKKR